MGDDERDALIANATTLALGELATWSRPRTLRGVGPHPDSVFFDFQKALNDLRSDIEARLHRTPTDERKVSYCGNPDFETSPFAHEHGIHHALSARIRALIAVAPKWFAGGWIVEGRLPDPAHWKSASDVTLEEAALLTVGVEPRLVDYKNLFRSYGKDPQTDEVLYFLEDRFEEIARGLAIAPETETPVPINGLVSWIVSTDISVALEFRKIFKPQFKADEGTSEAKASDMHHHTEHALHRIIIALADCAAQNVI